MLDKYHKKESPILGIAGMGGGTSNRLFGAVAFIDPPTITSPSASSTVDINGFTISSSTAVGEGFGTHTQSDWQVGEDANFNTIYEQSLADTSNLTSFTTTAGFDGTKTLYLRVRYRSDSGVESDYSNTVQVTGIQLYTFKLVLQAVGARGGQGNDGEESRDGGRGYRTDVTLETVLKYAATSPPSSLINETSVGSGGSGGGGVGGTGGVAARSKVDGVVVAVGGGGGGASPIRGGGTASSPQDSNSTVSNGTNAAGYQGGGGGAGTPGGNHGGTQHKMGGQGGGSYYPPSSAVINSLWNVTSRGGAVNHSYNGSSASATLYRKYKNESYTQVGSSSGNYNGTVANLI